MKKSILILLDTLESAGAENVAVNIATRLKKSEEFNPIVCSTRWGGVLEKTLRDYNVKCILLKRNRSYEVHKFHLLRRIIREENVQIIHSHKLWSNLWGSILGKICKVPVISHFHAHQAQVDGWSGLLAANAAKLIGKLSYKAISISRYEEQRLISEEGIPPSKIMTIYNGVEYSKYRTEPNLEIKRKLGINLDFPVVGIVAAFRPQKDHESFLLAAQQVLRKTKYAYFLLVGDGITRKSMDKLVSNLGISKHCLFTGFREDIPDIISIIDICVLSSHWEGQPLAVLEYMASSKPVISTNVSGLSEIVQDGINGFLVPPGDFKILAQRINLLLDNKDLALEMGRKGLLLIKKEFTTDSMMRKIEDLYAHVLEHQTC